MRLPSGPLSEPPFLAPGTLNCTTASLNLALGSDGSKTSVSAKGNSITPGLKRLYFGKSDLNEVSHVVMAEVLYYDTALSAAELAAAQSYMTSKYLSELTSAPTTTQSLKDLF